MSRLRAGVYFGTDLCFVLIFWIKALLRMAWFAPHEPVADTQFREATQVCLSPGGRRSQGPYYIELWGKGDGI